MSAVLRLLLGLMASVGSLSASGLEWPDTIRLSYPDYLGMVLENHPVSRQAALRASVGEAYVRAMRGAFDPYLSASWDAKHFSGKTYWQLFEGGLRVPTWFGVELSTTWTSMQGDYLDPSQTLPSPGQAALGISMNLGKGLLMDQRRADLLKAKWYAQRTLAEQRMMLLNLLAEATDAYWNWWLAHRNKNTFTEAMLLAQQRHAGVVASHFRGEQPAIDTLEAYLQVQNRIFNLSEAEVELAKALLTLNNFLWNPEGEPVEFSTTVLPSPSMPASPNLIALEGWQLDSLLDAHPDINYYTYQINEMEATERWQREQLKPELQVKYQALSANPSGDAWLGPFVPTGNLKWGIKFSQPLFLRKERGYLQLTRLQVQAMELQQDQKRTQLRNKIEALMVTLMQTQNQLALSQKMVDNYRALVDAELMRFQLGESSIFLINSREQKLVEAMLKLNETQAKIPRLIGEANLATGGYLLRSPTGN